MKKTNILVSILAICGLIFAWLMVFTAINPDAGDDYEPFPGAAIVAGLLTYFVIILVRQINSLARQKQDIRQFRSDIEVKQEHAEALLDELKETGERLLKHEETMSVKKSHSKIQERETASDNGDMRSHESNESLVEKDPDNLLKNYESETRQVSQSRTEVANDLIETIERQAGMKADQHLLNILAEIKELEVLITNQKLAYNQAVADYNTAIYRFPMVFLRASLGHQEESYYKEVAHHS